MVLVLQGRRERDRGSEGAQEAGERKGEKMEAGIT
jgi:hypothetical protein